jgi:hypothetical protein
MIVGFILGSISYWICSYLDITSAIEVKHLGGTEPNPLMRDAHHHITIARNIIATVVIYVLILFAYFKWVPELYERDPYWQGTWQVVVMLFLLAAWRLVVGYTFNRTKIKDLKWKAEPGHMP